MSDVLPEFQGGDRMQAMQSVSNEELDIDARCGVVRQWPKGE